MQVHGRLFALIVVNYKKQTIKTGIWKGDRTVVSD
jgi:hypothetical protein